MTAKEFRKTEKLMGNAFEITVVGADEVLAFQQIDSAIAEIKRIEQLFTNCLNPTEHPYYAEIAHLRVSSHFLIRRDGELVQFVNTNQRAWHAGVSSWNGRERCNEFSIGIELEGSDYEVFTEPQYETLQPLLATLKAAYPIQAITGHSDIAPLRKTDPGPFFDWSRINVSA